jgi:Tfp pilus assembly protein PilW
MSGPSPIQDQRGVTMVEMLVGMLIGIIVLGGVVALVTTTARSSGRVSERVAVDQVARPMMLRIMDELHSTCISPGIAPILAGSTDSSISFIHQTGSAVSPVPVKRTIALSSGKLTDTVYSSTGGSAGTWTFSTTPSSTYRLLDRVAIIGSTPIFSYYAYVSGVISTTPLATPLSAADSARTVQVNVSFQVSPAASATSTETGTPVQLTNSALLRFSPSNEDTAQAGLPCT